MSSLKVTVSMVTYNQLKYVEDSVLGALRQRTRFPFEVLVADDFSTDGTREWLMARQKEYPDRLRLILQPRNLGDMGKPNFACAIREARGEYVALLDGDDLYDDDTKLQQQVDFLDSNPECSGCCHDAWTLFRDGRRGDFPIYYPEGTRRLTLDTLFHYGFPHTTTLMFRRGIYGDFPDWYFKVLMTDWPITILCAEKGPWGYLQGRRMSTYRLHDTNYWMNIGTARRAMREVESYEYYDAHLKGQYRKPIQRLINHRQFIISQAFAEVGDLGESRRWFWKFLSGYGTNHFVSDRMVVQHAVRLALPGVFKRWQQRRSEPLPSVSETAAGS